ncbi:hypothetical protein QYM36_003091, partial [Artemia franciscana]
VVSLRELRTTIVVQQDISKTRYANLLLTLKKNGYLDSIERPKFYIEGIAA